MDINLIGIPIFYGADKRGPEYAPSKLRDKDIVSVLSKHNHRVYDFGNLHVPEIKEYNKFYSHHNLKYLKAIVEVNTNLAHVVYSSLKANSFPLVIGGDHSIGLGSISGVSKAYKNIAVIWMDAHGDINTQDTSESGNIHGMSLANAMGLGYEDLTNVYCERKKIAPENVFILGARDLDDGEKILIQEKNLNVYTIEKIRDKGIEKVVNEITQKLKNRNIEAIHLSFDVDFIDAKYVPGTGTPVGQGMNVEETKKLLKSLAETKLIKSMDFVELNTLLDKEDITADLAIDLLDWTFKYI
ncbi:arginase [Crassaminicella thermophila]|uniref:Arginase n=1 Tax=Crassaminicella thermophila TaxID=2599308 RepID=A0A5C0SB17_CRATE|nr:arginase [Crassaminicella thermophila]QEK11783.1 arginase [Crassaminicella thermophila]